MFDDNRLVEGLAYPSLKALELVSKGAILGGVVVCWAADVLTHQAPDRVKGLVGRLTTTPEVAVDYVATNESVAAGDNTLQTV